MITKIAILGSTGSIGLNAIDVIASLKDGFRITALAADSSVGMLARQAVRFHPKIVSIGERDLEKRVKSLVPRSTRVVSGMDGLNEIVSRDDVDLVLFGISGNSCLMPLINAIRHRKRIALANKEALVAGGAIVMKLARRYGVKVLPVDSEHSAIFQCIEGKRDRLKRIYLTGSGGPLLNVPKKRFDRLPPSFILKHPKWKMGKKISVDSATMMNKGLEIIEATRLFDTAESRIEVLIHPEAIIHSMVELVDGTIFAQLSTPDMRAPIQYALTYPARFKGMIERLDLIKTKALSFRKPDTGRFPCLGLAREAARAGGTHPAALSAADEEVVKMYLEGRVKFSLIPKVIEKVLGLHRGIREPALDDILETEVWAREKARSICCH